MRKSLIALVLPVLGLSTLASAYTVNVQVRGTNDTTGDLTPGYVGTAAASDTGTVWNSYAVGDGFGQKGTTTNGYTIGGLDDSQGTATGVTFTLTAQLNKNAGSSTPGFYAEPGNAFSTIANNLQTGYAFAGMGGEKPYIPSPIDTFEIGGLTPGAEYDIYLYGDYAAVSQNQTKYTIDGKSVTITNPIGGATAGVFIQGEDYALFQVAADGSGDITGTFTTPDLCNQNAAGILNGVQIQTVPAAVPLPAAAWPALGGLVCLAALRARRMLPV